MSTDKLCKTVGGIKWELSPNGTSQLSMRYFYSGNYSNIIGAQVYWRDKWQVRLWEMGKQSHESRKEWKQRGKGWKNLTTALFKANLLIADCVAQIDPNIFDEYK